MASFAYEALLNDKVRFLQGTQSDLNKYLPSSTDAKKGKALEGAFYLTTDTHKLYVGRKISTVPNPNPHSVAVGDVYPEEVSSGLTVVSQVSDLTTAAQNGQVHDGDIYYVQNGNILCVYEGAETSATIGGTTYSGWVQINAPGGIRGFTTTATADAPNNAVEITSTIETEKTGADRYKPTSFELKEGSNVQISVDSTVQSGDPPRVIISATDSTYAAGTAASASGTTNGTSTSATNGGFIGLKKNGGSTLDSTVVIKGANHVGVTSDAAGNITVSGPNFANKGVAASAVQNGNGFQFTLDYTPGDGSSAQSISHSTKSEIDPLVKYGVGSIDLGNNNTSAQETVHFVSGTATLNIYSKDETDAVIDQAISDRLAAANAMTYMGTIKDNSSTNSGVTATAVINTLKTNGTAHNGDTYKAACNFTWSQDGQNLYVKKGDLIIIRGTEVDGVIPSANFTVDVIPSGDEPFIAPSYTQDPDGTAVVSGTTDLAGTEIDLIDSKSTSTSLVAGMNIKGSDKILVASQIPNGQPNQINLTISHKGSAVTPVTNATLTPATLASTSPDGIGSDPVELYVLNSSSSIGTDNYGHVTGITGKAITFRHNRLRSGAVAYSSTAAANLDSGILSQGDATVTLYDTYSNAGASITLQSSTLQIGANDSTPTDATALAIDITWGAFN